MSTAPKSSPTLVWVDIPAIDVDRAIRFYAGVLAKPVHRQEFPGGVMGILPHGDGAVGGCLVACDETKPGTNGPLIYLDCGDRLDAAAAEVAKLGGAVLVPKHQIGPHGWRVVVRDSEGNRVALHAPPK